MREVPRFSLTMRHRPFVLFQLPNPLLQELPLGFLLGQRKKTGEYSVCPGLLPVSLSTTSEAGRADAFRPSQRELDAPPVAVSRVGCGADGIRRFCGCEAPFFGSH
jgi:hypothetical protein